MEIYVMGHKKGKNNEQIGLGKYYLCSWEEKEPIPAFDLEKQERLMNYFHGCDWDTFSIVDENGEEFVSCARPDGI